MATPADPTHKQYAYAWTSDPVTGETVAYPITTDSLLKYLEALAKVNMMATLIYNRSFVYYNLVSKIKKGRNSKILSAAERNGFF